MKWYILDNFSTCKSSKNDIFRKIVKFHENFSKKSWFSKFQLQNFKSVFWPTTTTQKLKIS